ncbi:hypothetical protein [Halosegnis marinus]|uniref:hypothetical protein n=1 Tax=Halosegnis marinus TaxID=3034023 RepID=UPI00361561D8
MPEQRREQPRAGAGRRDGNPDVPDDGDEEELRERRDGHDGGARQRGFEVGALRADEPQRERAHEDARDGGDAPREERDEADRGARHHAEQQRDEERAKRERRAEPRADAREPAAPVGRLGCLLAVVPLGEQFVGR